MIIRYTKFLHPTNDNGEGDVNLNTLLDKISKLESDIANLKESNENLKQENEQIVRFNRTLLDRTQTNNRKSITEDNEAKKLLEEYLKGE